MARSLSLLAIIAVVILFVAGCGDTVRNDDAVGQIRVMTYNVHHGAGTDGKLDLDRIAEVIRSEGADIAGLQEVDSNYSSRSDFQDQAKMLAEKLGMYYVYGPAIVSGDPANPNLYGDAILSRFPPIGSRVHSLRSREGYEPRVCLEVQVEIDAAEYTFMVTHLDHRDNQLRIAQAEDILKAAEGIKGPIVLMGDFNCLPPGEDDSAEWKAKTRPVGVIVEKFADAFLLAGGGRSATFGSARRIDYIFVSPDLTDKVKSCRVVQTPLTEVASDHWPVIAGLDL